MSTFSARDLAILLPDKVGDSFSLRHSEFGDGEDKESNLKPKLDATKKVTRYFPGKAPKWEKENEDEVSSGLDGSSDRRLQSSSVSAPEDRRLARLANTAGSGDLGERRKRRIYEATVVEDDDNKEESDNFELRDGDVIEGDAPILRRLADNEEEDEDEIAARRARIRQRLQSAQRELESASSTAFGRPSSPRDSDEEEEREEDEDEEEEIESEYETDSEEEEEDDIMRPVFVPKALRQSIKEREALALEEKLKEQKKMVEKEKRKTQTRKQVAESIRRMENATDTDITDAGSDAGLPDDVDDPDDEAEFESWKLRELARLQRDTQAREHAALAKADLERRKTMTDTERLAEDAKLGKFDRTRKSNYKYLQKYYHKGVFYMDDDSLLKDENDVRKKVYDGATGEDRFDKEAMPKIMQVKNFGRRGRTKYTHLADQDTSRLAPSFSAPPQKQIFTIGDRVGPGGKGEE